MRAWTEALRHLRAQPISAAVAVIAIAHAVFFAGSALWLDSQAAAARTTLSEGLFLTASLDPALDEAQVKATVDKLAAPSQVDIVRVRTPKEERERLEQTLGSGLLTGLDDLAVPMAVTVDLKLDPESLDEDALADLEKVVKELSGVQGVTAMPWDPSHIRTLFALSSLVKWLGLALGGAALLVALSVVTQLVRRRLEEGRRYATLARQFGATAAWIETPHYVTAAIIGVSGAVLAIVAALLVQGRLLAVTQLVPGLQDSAPILGGAYVVWAFALGLALALLGAWLSIRRAAEVESAPL